VIIEDKIRDRQAGRKFSVRLCPAANDLDKFPACLSPLVLPRPGISNRELTMRQASAPRLPRAHFAKGASAPQRTMRGTRFVLSNRELELLEPPLTHRKQTTAPRSNRELSTTQCSYNFHLSGALLSNGLPHQTQFLTGSGPQTEIDVTCSKQTTEKFLTGARTHIKETRICAKIDPQMNPQMSQIR
jgi:hypothetical protein